MKKIMLSIMMLTMVAGLSFADEGEQEKAQPQEQEIAKKVVKEVTLRTGTTESVTGKVESVKPADLLTRPRSSMVIVDTAGKTVEFAVKSLAVVYDQAGHFLSLDDVRPEQEVRVDYIQKDGKAKEAAAIKILK